MVLGGVVVLVVVVEFDNAGPDSFGTKASTAAPAMIRPDEQAAAKIFQFIGELRPGSPVMKTHVRHDRQGREVQSRRGLLCPLPPRRRAHRVVLQFLAGARVARRCVAAAGEQHEARLSVRQICADHDERLEAHIVGSFGK